MAQLRNLALLKRRVNGEERVAMADEDEVAQYLSRSGELPVSIMAHDVKNRDSDMTLEKVTLEAKGFVAGIFEDWTQLLNLLNKHGETVQRRWSRKTTGQRKKTLLTIWPDMAGRHRPDIYNLARIDMAQRLGNMEKVCVERNDCFYPYINLDDLSKTRTFLVLLEARTRTTPDVFANADMNSVRLGMKYENIKTGYLKGYTMHLVGEDTPETYGRVTCWKGNPKSAHAWVTGLGTQPGDGLLILEIQQQIFQCLLGCTKQLLQDIHMESIDSAKSPAPVFSGFKNGIGTEEPSHLDRLIEAPHEVPDQFEFGRLHKYVNAKRDEVEDHLWLLREDPAYFGEALREFRDHHSDVMFVKKGVPIPQLKTTGFWNDVVIRVLFAVYRDLMMWDVIRDALRELDAIRQRHESALRPGQRVPTEYKEAFSHFINLVEEMIKTITEDSKQAIMACRAFQKHFERDNFDAKGRADVHMQKNPTDMLWWLTYQLLLPGDLDMIGLPNLLSEIERLITINNKERGRLTPTMLRFISDFSILAELQRHLGLSTPGGRIASAVSAEQLDRVHQKRTAPMCSVIRKLEGIIGFGAHGMDLAALEYPLHKRRDATTTAQLRSAEAKLDQFWNAVDDYFIHSTGSKLHAQPGLVIGLRRLVRTPEWTELELNSTPTAEASKAIESSLILSTLEDRTERNLAHEEAQPVKEKARTRPITIDAPVKPIGPRQKPGGDDLSTVDIADEIFKLKKRDYRMVSMLFHVPSRDRDAAGELPWIDFLHTMASLGFGVKKLDGSASLISPVARKLTRSIIFHEPHPEKSIPFHVARTYGRRLTRAYGWTAESFVRE